MYQCSFVCEVSNEFPDTNFFEVSNWSQCSIVITFIGYTNIPVVMNTKRLIEATPELVILVCGYPLLKLTGLAAETFVYFLNINPFSLGDASVTKRGKIETAHSHEFVYCYWNVGFNIYVILTLRDRDISFAHSPK